MSNDGGCRYSSQPSRKIVLVSRLLITGADGFTGKYLAVAAKVAGYEVFALRTDIRDLLALEAEVASIKPTHVVHLAAISDANSADEAAYYQINLFGSLNLLKALEKLEKIPERIILASSANIYGENSGELILETCTPVPVNHYAMSKLAMEYMALNYSKNLPISFTRPFNYTGVGHDNRFVIPKIIEHFRVKASHIELGNLYVKREYNDVRDIVSMYLELLKKAKTAESYNLASGIVYGLNEVLELLFELTGHRMEVKVNPKFVRKNEITILSGSIDKLKSLTGDMPKRELLETLSWMMNCSDTNIAQIEL